MPTSIDPQQLMSPAALGGAAAFLAAPPVASTLGENRRYGLTTRFTVTVSGLDLGEWSSCKGLQVDFKTKKHHAGGNSTTPVLLREDIEYGKITLERAMSKRDSTVVREWLRGFTHLWSGAAECHLATMTIKLHDSRGDRVATWSMDGYPSSWRCSDFSTATGAIAVETLSFEHTGFLR